MAYIEIVVRTDSVPPFLDAVPFKNSLTEVAVSRHYAIFGYSPPSDDAVPQADMRPLLDSLQQQHLLVAYHGR